MDKKSEECWNNFKMKNINRIVIKVGSSTLIHKDTGNLNYLKLEKIVRMISDLKNKGKEVILVSSGAVAVGREILKIGRRPKTMAEKQACASIGQGRLIMNYYKIFSEYGIVASQILMTKYNIKEELGFNNLKNTFNELLNYGVVPIVNENDTIATDEIEFGENDKLSAIVSCITNADLLIILTDTNGLYTDNPSENKDAELISAVNENRKLAYKVAKNSSDTDVGTGGMYTKVLAANIVNNLGIDMIITSGKEPNIVSKIIRGERKGTLFVSNKKDDNNDVRSYLMSCIEKE